MNRPVHFEILADDPEGLSDFYSNVLGWSIKKWDGPQTYWLTNTGEEERGIHGAIMHRHFEQAVINTCEVESLADMTRVVEESGGRLIHGPTEIPGAGRHAYFADPEGNLFGLIQPPAE